MSGNEDAVNVSIFRIFLFFVITPQQQYGKRHSGVHIRLLLGG